MSIAIRAASEQDGEELRRIERLAGQAFADIGMVDIATDEPPSLEVLAHHAAAGRSWVAEDERHDVVGYVLVDVVDDNAHVEQVSVRPDQQGRGVGRSLLAWVDRWAAENGLGAVTLTTFRDVPWNAPLYEHLGFRILEAEEIGPQLAAVVADEAAHGLDPDARVCMRKQI